MKTVESEAKDSSIMSLREIIDNIVKKPILLKFAVGSSLHVDGRIFFFSDYIKNLTSKKSFDNRIILDNVDLRCTKRIIEFLEVLNWNDNPKQFVLKSEELNNWFSLNKANMKLIVSVIY